MGGLKTSPLPPTGYEHSALPPEFGRVVEGFSPRDASTADYEEVERLLYEHSVLIFRDVDVDPPAQLKLTQWFDKAAQSYGHGSTTSKQVKSILHPDLKTLPKYPQVQLIGNGVPTEERITQGLDKPRLKHPQHYNFHRTVVSPEDDAKGITRFYRWHIDAALYDLSPPVATTLYALKVPGGPMQTVRYDDGTGDELPVSLGTTAFVSGTNMFEILPPELKSLAVRAKVRYAPHPYVWMTPSKAMSTGLGIESDGLEVPKAELPAWTDDKVKTYPLLWKNPQTGKLHFQVHPCGIEQIFVDALPAGYRGDRNTALYPDGTTISDLKEVRDLMYKLQRPAISPKYVYAHNWKERDLCLFHNRGVLHTVVGSFKPEEVRAFWQCNLASTQEPVPPSQEDVQQYA